jgi:hypothetical protein
MKSVLIFVITAESNMNTVDFWTTASVIQWSEFLTANAEVLGSIPGATKFSV